MNEYVFAYSLEAAADRLPCPVKVIGADPSSWFSLPPSIIVEGATAVRYNFVPETTHYLQLEKPGECAALLVRFLERRSLG